MTFMGTGVRRLGRLTLACACAAGCGGPTLPSVLVNEAFTLAPGEAASVSGTDARLRFISVEGDSRCPADALCIQGGDALVTINAWSAGTLPRRYDLHTGDMRPVVHDGLTIALVQLSPYPFSSTTIQQNDYRATLRVSF